MSTNINGYLNQKPKKVNIKKEDLYDPNTILPTLEDVEQQGSVVNPLWNGYVANNLKIPALKQQTVASPTIPQTQYRQIPIDADGQPVQVVPQDILNKDPKLTQFWSGKINPITGERVGGYKDVIEGGLSMGKSIWDIYSAYNMGKLQEDALNNQMDIDNENAYIQEENLLNTRADRAEARARLDGKNDQEALRIRKAEEDKLKKNLKYLR
jgi:hypothetical protein